jgi:hypothetical protein
MHSNVMHRFMVQAFQDPPLCSSTLATKCSVSILFFTEIAENVLCPGFPSQCGESPAFFFVGGLESSFRAPLPGFSGDI